MGPPHPSPRAKRTRSSDGGPTPAGRRGSSTPSPATPLAIVARTGPGLDALRRAWRQGHRPSPPPAHPPISWPCFRNRGACFRSELAPASGRMSAEVDEGLWDLGRPRASSPPDAFSAVRSLLSARLRLRRSHGAHRGAARRAVLGRQRATVGTGIGEGRWSLLPEADNAGDRVAERATGRGVGRSRGLAAPGPMGSRGLGALGTRVVPDPVA